MFALLAHSPTISLALASAGILVFLISGIWSLVVAVQRGVLWLLAVIFIPLAAFIFLFVEPRAVKPFLYGLLGMGLFAWAVIGVDGDESFSRKFGTTFRMEKEGAEDAKNTQLEAETPQSLEEKKNRLREWQKRLETKKAAIRPGDATAQAVFDKELKEYLEELDHVKIEISAAEKK